ncbi:MAG TPA: DNA translocase FtsK 4TM domain-containing protein [Rubrobacteraceae bacterium]|nr:DNA translocase FtsK 4TM domain-containing protein [Rubrobacteraceae bacterium]
MTKAPAKKHRGSKNARKGMVSRFWERVRGWLAPEVIGGVLLAVGLFFTAAFVSGRGAWLGDTGLMAATHLMGVAGYALAPLGALAGGLLLLQRLPAVRTFGGGLILLGFATSMAARLPEGRLFEAGEYDAAGGIVGSAIYGAVYWTGGVVGAAVALVFLYAVGLSLLTGISFESALGASRTFLTSSLDSLREWRKRRAEAAEKAAAEQRKSIEIPSRSSRAKKAPKPAQGVVDLYPELDKEESAKRAVPESQESFEVVLPEERQEPAGEPVIHQESEGSASGEYTPPPMSLLKLGGGGPHHDAEGTSQRLTQALADLGVAAQVVRAVVGPRVTRYELRLGSGVKVGKVSNLQQDIAYALAATEVRILAPIPGKSAVGVEVPNTRPATVTLGDVFQDYPEGNDWALPVGLGKDISGRAVFLDLADMPHLLVAGTTGSGKSVMLNGLLTSLLLATDPREVKMVLIDPKRVELSQFARIPHLITPVVTDVKKAANALGWAVAEMERRYEVLEQKGVRSLEGYNARAEYPMPYVLVVIDELADLMMQAGAKVEDAIVRLAQKARAVGIHLVVATQRPSVDVITGMIKANIPSRIAFAVSSQVDSRVILDTSGAEALLGMGDMLYKPVSAARASRVQGAFISEAEVERVVSASVAAARGKAETEFVEEVTAPKNEKQETGEPEDELLPEAASFVVATQQASVSAVQRRFRVGYSRAGRIIDALERKGIVGPYEGSKSRSVVASELELSSIFSGESSDGGGSGGPSGTGEKQSESW